MIEFRNVTKSYGDFTAVEDISFSACDSSVCGLIGYNGAGKTTLIKCAAGLYKPDSGKVLIDGESTYNSDEVRSRLFFVPDDLFFPVGSTPNSAARFYKDYYPEFSFGNFERMLKLFELDGDAKIRGFSKGMQRQTEIALALASSPKVLLLDECLDGLDIAKKGHLQAAFHGLHGSERLHHAHLVPRDSRSSKPLRQDSADIRQAYADEMLHGRYPLYLAQIQASV